MNSTFTANTGGSGGGAVHAWGAVTITDSTFTNNSTAYTAGGVAIYGSATIVGGLFSGNVGGPSFIGGGDLRLKDDSPLVDLGTNAAFGGVGTLDIAGSPRINGIIDLGAYESAPLMSDGFE